MKKFLYLVAAVFCFSTSVNTVFIPHNIVGGGVTGLAVVVKALFGIQPAQFVFGINLIFLVLAAIFISKEFALKTFVGSNVLYPFFLTVIPVQSFTDDLFLAAVTGGVISGIGMYFLYLSEGSTGGTTILGKILNKYSRIRYALAVAVFDFLIILSGLIVFDLEVTLYAIVLLVVMTFIADTLETGLNKTKVVHVISSENGAVRRQIIEGFNRGATVIKAEGAYTGAEKDFLVCVVKNKELIKLKQIVKEADDSAFLYVLTASSTIGEGFSVFEDSGR